MASVRFVCHALLLLSGIFAATALPASPGREGQPDSRAPRVLAPCRAQKYWKCFFRRPDCVWNWACNAAQASAGQCDRCADIDMGAVSCETRKNSDPTGYTSSKWKCGQHPFAEKCEWKEGETSYGISADFSFDSVGGW